MTLRLRCIRCGDWSSMIPEGPGLCGGCHIKLARAVTYMSRGRRYALWLRWQKHSGRHPTFKALSAALDAMQATPPGRLDDPLVIVDAVMAGIPPTAP